MRNRTTTLFFVAVTAVVAFASPPAHAHRASDALVKLHVAEDSITARLDLSLRDLDFVVGLDDDGDGAVTWGELKNANDRIADYVLSRFSITAGGGRCAASAPHAVRVARHSDGAYAVLDIAARCRREGATHLDVDYTLFFDVDSAHRGLMGIEGLSTGHALFGPSSTRARVELSGGGSAAGDDSSTASWSSQASAFARFLVEGVWHILIGFDHILFLLALLMPAVLRREGGRWQPHDDFRAVAREVLSIVTAFTIAHTITLCLAATDTVRLPSRVVESGIAVSVVLVAFNNLVPVIRDARWTLTFALGLLHGFGFSSVLADLGLPADSRLVPLLGFNVGVEIGQLTIVAVVLPIAFCARRTTTYRRGVVVGGSLIVMVLAAVWAIERGLAVTLFPSWSFT